MEQTALDWYWDKIKSHFEHDGDLFEVACMTFSIAKQKEREQIINANADGQYLNSVSLTKRMCLDNAECYYNETYGGNK